jgi:GNAT superfamily N-acetyltransferase
MEQNLTCRSLDRETWPDFERMFMRHKGVCGGCWCVYHRVSSSAYKNSTREDRYALMKSYLDDGTACGIVVYDNGEPVGWCNVGPAEYFVSFDRSPAYRLLNIPENLRPKWRIACVFVDKGRRRQHLSGRVLAFAIDAIAKNGGGVTEAFPIVLETTPKPSYTGKKHQYEALGFSAVAPMGTHRLLMRAIVPARQANEKEVL